MIPILQHIEKHGEINPKHLLGEDQLKQARNKSNTELKIANKK